ncbi:plasmid mobilization protein [Mucilaginibacter ginsenosidivorax]|uniref:MobC family plasmid mobilization relaxosome protein n=1 Tax=Mucilaginibacter ginsenosidivorax TaxID=862126 RepID=A0A5B8VWK4_9SPHI|nr:plasmid mobilization relaxosome protein MobC [Mucilaginibacter ginsenosidivorax]QEC74618.1 MobC family plasmid mobilization relaxosome protein [Mucilaginibacter ginsenosidivorax]
MADLKKLNGRPKLEKGRRSNFINVRFTDDEYKEIVEIEQQLGISKTELIRMRILSDVKQTVVNAKELIIHLDAIGAEMGRIGNNINQLARHANTLKLKGTLSPLIIEKFNRLFEDYIQMQQLLEAALRKIIRTMGY